jgi:hypothetical protein
MCYIKSICRFVVISPAVSELLFDNRALAMMLALVHLTAQLTHPQ